MLGPWARGCGGTFQSKRLKEGRGQGFGEPPEAPRFCLAAVRDGTAQGGKGLHEKAGGTPLKFNYCPDLHTETDLWVLV